MRKGWEYKKLGEYVKEYSVKNKLNENIPVYSVTNSQGFCKDYFGKEVASKDKSTYKIVPFGFFAYNPSRINVGSIDWQAQEDRVIVSPLYNVFSVSAKLKQQYLLYYLKSPLTIHYIDSVATGTVRLNLKFSMLKEFIVPVPSIAKQEYIVSELDKINELIRLKKEQLKDFDNLAQSLFYEMFGDPVENEMGWEVKKLGEIGEFKNGLNFSKDENGHSIKFLGVSDFQNKKSIASDQLAYISLSERVQEDYLLKTGDIVFVRSNGKKELIGRSVKMYITEPTTYSGFCIRCRITDEKVDKDYIAILLKTPIIRQFMTNSGRGCNISNLNQKVLNSIPTILPPLSLQRLFAQRIEQIEREKSEVQKSIQDLETLLASRMQYWFE